MFYLVEYTLFKFRFLTHIERIYITHVTHYTGPNFYRCSFILILLK